MTKENIINEINKISSENGIKIKINNQNINKNFKDLGADSLTLIDMIMKLEQKFNIVLPDDDLMKVKTANDLIELISKNLK